MSYKICLHNLGNAYYHDDGTPRNYPKAMEWYEKVANQGHAKVLT